MVKAFRITSVIVIFAFSVDAISIAQQATITRFPEEVRRALTGPELPDASDEWIERSLDWAFSILEMFPPERMDHPGRIIALTRLDDVLLMEAAPERNPVREAYRARMRKAVEEIEEARVTEGMRIWKLYSSGFFVRTATVSFVFDIVTGAPGKGFTVDADLLERLADQADAHFISHRHYDHACEEVARIFLAREKPIVGPEELWADHPEFASTITRPARSAEIVHEIPVRGGTQMLKVVAYPGYQSSVENNVHLVITPEGLSVIHFGDRSGTPREGSDWDWIPHVGYTHDVDVMLGRAWTNQLPAPGEAPTPQIQREARGVDPRVIVTSHDNELGHRSLGRVGYTQFFHQLYGSRYPFVIMAWAESYQYRRWP